MKGIFSYIIIKIFHIYRLENQLKQFKVIGEMITLLEMDYFLMV
jgi:hypothetical protein